jgi:hypothetical protein
MQLPVRILDQPPGEPVLLVDGTFGAERERAAGGLNLSHWPGHATPRDLRHDLSTGCALRFAALDPAERRRLARGAVAIANNHYDTDGVLAIFATRHPELALPRAPRLLAAAAAGDFFQLPDEDALALDALVGALPDPERSPFGRELAPLPERERHERCIAFLLEHLPALLDGDLASFGDLWRPELEAARCDLEDLARAEREERRALDLTCWRAPQGARSGRPGAGERFDPGRHALFGSTRADRVLSIGPGGDGTSYRLVFSTLSWFDLVGPRRLPRPDLEALAARLNELEGSAPGDAHAWRAQPADSPAPELWFGAAQLDSFAEHNPALVPSRLLERELRAVLEPALRPRCARGRHAPIRYN